MRQAFPDRCKYTPDEVSFMKESKKGDGKGRIKATGRFITKSNL